MLNLDIQFVPPNMEWIEARFEATKFALETLLKTYELNAYLFTTNINIEYFSTPRSHPVLTLNTRVADDPDALLSMFLHEQIHWFLDAQGERTENAIARFRDMYPKVPADLPEGATDEYSTYLHLAVNWLELKACEVYLGPVRARELLSNAFGYHWIYRTVISDDEKIAAVMNEFDLVI